MMRRSPCEAEAGDVGEGVDPGDVWEGGPNGEEDLDGVRDVRWRWPRLHWDGAMGSCKKKRWRGEGHPEGAEKRERRGMVGSGRPDGRLFRWPGWTAGCSPARNRGRRRLQRWGGASGDAARRGVRDELLRGFTGDWARRH